jgi:hypothetical protein
MIAASLVAASVVTTAGADSLTRLGCDGDATQDGYVNTKDILHVISDWGDTGGFKSGIAMPWDPEHTESSWLAYLVVPTGRQINPFNHKESHHACTSLLLDHLGHTVTDCRAGMLVRILRAIDRGRASGQRHISQRDRRELSQ